ncbi:MAG: hypothetical protein Q8873_04630 [Bacillota bacterium]|nr:hypothetical protein [Bacillota bacterium]
MQNDTAKQQQAWETFNKTGKVGDYLTYNNMNKDESYENDKNKGNSGGANQAWRV